MSVVADFKSPRHRWSAGTRDTAARSRRPLRKRDRTHDPPPVRICYRPLATCERKDRFPGLLISRRRIRGRRDRDETRKSLKLYGGGLRENCVEQLLDEGFRGNSCGITPACLAERSHYAGSAVETDPVDRRVI